VRATLPKAGLDVPPAGRVPAGPGAAGLSGRMRTALVQVGPPALLLAAIVGAWEWGVAAFGMPFYVLPAPSRILALAVAERALLLDQAAVTLLEIFVGFGIALVVGVGLALLIFSSRTIERAVYPLVIATQTVPIFAIAPLLIVWLGYGLLSKVAMAALIVFFPIVVNTVDGLRAADPDAVNLLLILGATPPQVLMKIRAPAALPFLFSGVRIAIATSVIGAVIGEWVGSTQGLGFLMIHANAQLHIDLVFAAIFVLSFMAVGLFLAVTGLEWLLLPWRRPGNA
jgi:putative hydroxymethylpyrimidine transport system permease protein